MYSNLSTVRDWNRRILKGESVRIATSDNASPDVLIIRVRIRNGMFEGKVKYSGNWTVAHKIDAF